MNIEERKEWGLFFERLEEARRYEIDLEKKIIEEEREKIKLEIDDKNKLKIV